MHDIERAGIEIVNMITESRTTVEVIDFGTHSPRARRTGAE
jgi:hypothetical protein